MDIYSWLDKFAASWTTKDIDAVMNLFVEDVEYWETPHRKLSSFDELRKEWQIVRNQKNILITTKVFSEHDNRSSVTWRLSYQNDLGTQNWTGTYLIELNDNGKCVYFHQTGERQLGFEIASL